MKKKRPPKSALSLDAFTRAKTSTYDKRVVLEKQRNLDAAKVNKYRKVQKRLGDTVDVEDAFDPEKYAARLEVGIPGMPAAKPWDEGMGGVKEFNKNRGRDTGTNQGAAMFRISKRAEKSVGGDKYDKDGRLMVSGGGGGGNEGGGGGGERGGGAAAGERAAAAGESGKGAGGGKRARGKAAGEGKKGAERSESSKVGKRERDELRDGQRKRRRDEPTEAEEDNEDDEFTNNIVEPKGEAGAGKDQRAGSRVYGGAEEEAGGEVAVAAAKTGGGQAPGKGWNKTVKDKMKWEKEREAKVGSTGAG